MNEIEKMRNGELADMSKPEMQESFIHTKKLLARLRTMSSYDEGYRELLENLIPGIPESSIVCPPFHCDHGHGFRLGKHVFNGDKLIIGKFCKIASGVTFRMNGANHQMNAASTYPFYIMEGWTQINDSGI